MEVSLKHMWLATSLVGSDIATSPWHQRRPADAGFGEQAGSRHIHILKGVK